MTTPGPLASPVLARLSSASIALVAASLLLPGCGGAEEKHGGGHGEHGEIEIHMGRKPPPPPKKPALDPAALRERATKVVGVLPESFPRGDEQLSQAQIDLGRMLYYDTRLSTSGEIACNSCHLLDEHGVDGQETSPGHDGTFGERNSPTVYNAAGQLAQFWDGRAADVEEQAKGPILNPVEMGMPDEATVLATLENIPGYVEAFAAAFPEAEDPVTFDNMAKAIGAFERKLTTPAPIDAWLAGDDEALSEQALAGLALFLETDCQSCHNGYGFGGSSFQKLGTETPWPGLEDVGREEVTHDKRDKYVFKVPMLRNIEKTAPYLHNGSIPELVQMVTKMVEHQTKRDGPFSEEEMANMLAFLGSLTGEIPEDYIARPELPESPAAEPAEAEPAEAEPAEAEPAEAKPAKAEPAEAEPAEAEDGE